MFDASIVSLPVCIALAILLVAAVSIELATTKLPNWLTLTGMIAGIALAGYDKLWLPHLSGLMIGFALGTFLFITGWAPGGAAKLFFAVGSIGGPVFPLTIVVVSIIWAMIIRQFIGNDPGTDEEGGIDENTSPRTIPGSLVIAFGTGLAFLFIHHFL